MARYGVGVPHSQHAALLEIVGLQPEFDASGRWEGADAQKAEPLADPDHVFNCQEWREVVAEALADWRHDVVTPAAPGGHLLTAD